MTMAMCINSKNLSCERRFKGLKFLIKKGFYLFIVTNQAGITKGYYKEKDFYILHKKIKIFLSKSDVFLHDVKFSPFHRRFI